MGIALTPQQAADVESIRQLACLYALAVDSRDLDLMQSIYADDVDRGSFGRGHDALRRSLEQSLSAVGTTVHTVANHVVRLVDDSHATGTVYHRGDSRSLDGTWRTRVGIYDDVYERRAGGWVFVSRQLRYWYEDVPVPAPGTERLVHAITGTSPAMSGDILPDAWPSWGAFWAQRDASRETSAADDSLRQ